MITNSSNARARTVLCIDDNDSLAQLVALILRRIPGVRVLIAGSRRDALRTAATTRCDLVLTDLHLADASGVAWVTELVNVESLLDVPVVVMSAHSDPRTIEAVMMAGAAQYLIKPVDRRQLTALVASLGGPSSVDEIRGPGVAESPPPRTLLDRCLTEATLDLEQMHEAIARRDFTQFEWLCHRLKGRALMFGMAELLVVLEQIETLFRPDQPDILDRLVTEAERSLDDFRLD